MYGPSRTAAPGELLGYVRTEGTCTVRNDSLFRRATVTRSWDRNFYGGAVIVTPVTEGGVLGDAGGARYEILGETLVLHYLSYPADAAVETSQQFQRVH